MLNIITFGSILPKNKIVKFLSILLFFVSSTLVSGELPKIPPEEAGYDSKKLATISEGFDALYEDGLIPNYVIAVAKEGKIFYSAYRGESRVGSGNQVDLDTIYPMASMTKPLVSTAIFRLIEEGKLSLDSELREFLPEFGDMFVAPGGSLEQLEEANRQVTILDLLTHTSGLTYGEYVTGSGDVAKLYDELVIIDRCKTADENMEILSQIPLIAQPGTEWNYSVGIDVLGAVIEAVTGVAMSDYLREIILDPLGMTNSGFTLPEDQLANNWAQIYGLPTPNNPAIGQIGGTGIDWKIAEIDGNENVERQTFSLCPYGMADTDPRYKFDSGGGGISTSSMDYLIFMSMIAGGGELNGVQVIQPDSVEAMFTEQVEIAYPAQFGNNIFGAGFGINLEVDDPSKVDFYRWGGAFNTGFWMDPEDGSVGVVATSHWPGRYNRGNAIEQMLDDARITD